MIPMVHAVPLEGVCGELLEPYCGECHEFLSLQQVRDFMDDLESVEDVSDASGMDAPALWLCEGSSSVCECRALSVYVHAWTPEDAMDSVRGGEWFECWEEL